MKKQLLKNGKVTNKLVAGEKLTRLSYITVIDPKVQSAGGQLTALVKNEDDFQWNIGLDIIDAECISTTQFSETKAVSQTEMIQILLEKAGHVAFTANFNKKPDMKAAETELKNLYPNKGIKGVGIASRDDFNKGIKAALSKIMVGEERTIIARIMSIDSLRGRIQVVDLEAPAENNIRQIDPRTLNWLILNNVKYVLK